MSKCQPSKRNNLKKGLTLIEILVAITLSLIIFGALYGIYIVSHKLYIKSVAKAELNQNGRISLERITRDLRQTTDITGDLPLPTSSSIMFQDGHNTSPIQYIKYSLVGNELHRQLIHYFFSSDSETWVKWDAMNGSTPATPAPPDEDMVKADKINAIEFSGNTDNTIITINITATDSQNNNANFQTEVYCRNI